MMLYDILKFVSADQTSEDIMIRLMRQLDLYGKRQPYSSGNLTNCLMSVAIFWLSHFKKTSLAIILGTKVSD